MGRFTGEKRLVLHPIPSVAGEKGFTMQIAESPRKTPVLREQKEKHWQTFLTALITAAAFFVPFIILDQGYFLFYGDFNVQQVPFYQMCHQMVRSGNIFWNWQTDLGANFIGSYSFYLLGSPFFWLTLPFPNWMVPHLIGPLLILKFACSAFTAYFYIRRFTKSPDTAMVAGLLYAFSGFSVYNIFFNHFHEAIVFFPVLLLAVEQFIADNRRGALTVAVFICAVSNYFFFAGMVTFAVIYWFVRMLFGCWKLSLPRLGWFAFEIAAGLLMSAVILIPSALSVLQNPRVDKITVGWGALLYGKEQIYPNILEVFFFPPDLPARPVFFPDADVKWSSLGGWLPIFSMTGVFALFQSKKKHWLRRVLVILTLMALVPILNSAFYMFNSAYYARWYYMPVLMMCLATAISLEDREADWPRALKWTAGITVGITLIVGLFPAKLENGKITQWGLYTDAGSKDYTYFARFWITCGIAIAGLLILKLLLPLYKKSPAYFARMAVGSICIISVIYASFFIGTGKTNSVSTKDVIIPQLLQGEVTLPDNPDNYRIDVYSGEDNTGMYLGFPCIQSFHSIVPASVMDYYPYVKVDRGVASRPKVEAYAIRPFLSVRYLLDREGGDDFVENGSTKMPGWSYYKSQSGYNIYENNLYIPYGFTYDYYMTEEQCNAFGEDKRSSMMLKAILLTPDQIKRNKDILTDIGTAYHIPDANQKTNRQPQLDDGLPSVSFTDNEYEKDCKKLAATSAFRFQRDNRGFTAETTLDRENLVFFSVPYEENGWTATVNGQPVPIEKVNVGFMAVRAPAGTSTIRFTYMTPGLKIGALASAGGLAVFLVYLLVWSFYRRKNPERCVVEYPEGEEMRSRWAEEERADAEALLLEQMKEEEQLSLLDFSENPPPYPGQSFSPGFTVDLSDEDEPPKQEEK